ncbi:MAG: hypothetical protein JWR21_871 [Herminiimonas sp.]|nr:hypothetical protein [Herminiimonas sp.]
MSPTVFALTLVFADGYLNGSTHARDFKDLASCNAFGAQMSQQYTGYGHPTSFFCAKAHAFKGHKGPPTVSVFDPANPSKGMEPPTTPTKP